MIISYWKRNVEPPTVPSRLLALALRDLIWAEKHPKYDIDMGTWVDNCSVCFAGSVIVRRFKNINGCCPNDFSPAWSNAFYALDAFRQGNVVQGLRCLGVKRKFASVYVSVYGCNPIAFKRNIRCLIARLRREGL